MSTFTQIYYHIVFSTKNRKKTLDHQNRDDLYRYLWGILNKKHCHLYRIGGMTDHVHLFMSLHPAIALAALVKDMKVASSQWIREQGIFPYFTHWQEGYGAFTHSFAEKSRLISYIKGQHEHHREWNFKEELAALLKEAGVEYDEKYLV